MFVRIIFALASPVFSCIRGDKILKLRDTFQDRMYIRLNGNETPRNIDVLSNSTRTLVRSNLYKNLTNENVGACYKRLILSRFDINLR